MLCLPSDPLPSPPACCWRHQGEVRGISLVSNSTAIHILGESIAINKAIQKRQVQTRQREQQPDLIRTQGQQAGPFSGCLHGVKKKSDGGRRGQGEASWTRMKGKGGEGEEAGSEQRGLRAEGLTHEPSPWGQILTLPLATEDSKPLTPPKPWLADP